MKDKLRKLWRENRTFLMFLALMFVFRSAVADWNEVPTGSMKPTIVEGDRIWVDKMAYDLRVPFTHISVWKRADPKRGDIVVFDSHVANERLVKRVVGLPGDIVAMRDNVLSINGKPLQYQELDAKTGNIAEVENLVGVQHRIWIHPNGSRLSSFGPVRVPKGYYLMLGDNRDNSADSRVIGFVPRNEIVGRTRSVVLSLNYDNYDIPRRNRFLHTL